VDFSKQIQKADEAAKKRNYDFAVELYQQILEIDADQGDARAGLRQALKRRHEHKKGGFLRALSAAPQLAAAKALHKARKYDACAKTLESYLATNPLDEDANVLLGTALEEGRHYKSARAVYEFITEIAPKNCSGLKRAGAMSWRLGDHVKALEYYERALAADPRDQEAIKARKDLAAEHAMSRSSLPITHSRDQIKDKDRAAALERDKRLHQSDDELRADLARLEERYAENRAPELMARMAEIHERLRDPESALEWIERALSYRKDDAALAARAGDLRAKSLKKAIAQAGKDGNQARADELERELWRIEADEMRRRVQLNPGDLATRLQLARRLARMGEHDAAIGELQKAVADPRQKREAQFLLGTCFQAKGYRDLARKEYNNALEGSPPNDERTKEILYNLGGLAEAENDTAQARACYSRVFEVDIGYRDVAQKMERFR
jgi:tetratricopeptide (TPR) repeat protein